MQPENVISPMCFSPVPARKPNKEAAHVSPPRADVLRFFGFWRGWGHKRSCDLCPHSDKTGGFQRGALSPFGTRLCRAKCSVLYLLARLTGEAGCGASCAPACTGRKTGRIFVNGSEQKPCPFSGSGGRYTSSRPSSPFCLPCA